MPGFNFIPLSMLSLVTPELLKTETVPVSEETKQHDGNDVLCLPFSVTPFHLPDVARELPTSKATIADVLRFEPRSVKETSFAAYPVLVPIYLAQYQAQAVVDGDLQYTTITAFIEAGVPNGRCVAEVLPGVDDLLSAFNVPVPDLFVRGPHAELVRKFATVCSLIAPNATLRHRELIERWADSAMCPAHALERYRDRFFGTTERAARAAVDWADPRIRPFEPAEREANAQWLSSGADLFLLRMMMDVYNSKREGGAAQQEGGQDARVPSESEVEWVKTQIAQVEKQRADKKPPWLATWEIQQNQRRRLGLANKDAHTAAAASESAPNAGSEGTPSQP